MKAALAMVILAYAGVACTNTEIGALVRLLAIAPLAVAHAITEPQGVAVLEWHL